MKVNGSRREFIIGTGRVLSLSLIGGGLWSAQVDKNQLNAEILRPPGAKTEADFTAACIKCGQCVDACPYGTLSLIKTGDSGQIGTPYFVAREIPCYMCPDVPCARICPSGALDQKVQINDSRMGLAVLLDQENCIAFQGLRCEVCYRECPLLDQAITLNYRAQKRTGKHAYFEPIVHSDACTGCGRCERVCILEEPAIKVLPLTIAKGKMGENYRLGWKEQSAPDSQKQREIQKPADENKIDNQQQLQNTLDALNDDGTLYD